MRKLALSILLAGSLGAGCTQTGGEGAIPPVPSNPQPPVSVTPASEMPTLSMGKTAAEQTSTGDKSYFQHAPKSGNDYVNEKVAENFEVAKMTAGSPANNGVVVGRQIRRERLSGQPAPHDGSMRPEPSPEPERFKAAFREPLSTFSADVDTASFANVRRELHNGVLPQPDLVRVEEMLNYFNYDLPEPKGNSPFSVTTELSDCPWSKESRLMRVAIKTKSLDRGEAPARNLVFLLDVSGSMNAADKLPLLKNSLRTLVDTLDDSDRVAIVVYAGASGLVLPSTTGDNKTAILDAIERLEAGGSTNGASGIELAYLVAEKYKTKDSVNRVILATDGDFNVGISSNSELKSFIEEKRESGLFLSVLGFGRGGNDKLMETLADNGNGNYASIDSLNEARKVLVQEAGATLVTVAKDVKFQVAFDPKVVESYRLIGYKNRRLANRDFDDDTKDAGELGAGHSVTALYEIRMARKGVDQSVLDMAGLSKAPSPATVKLRYKAPDAKESQLMSVAASSDLRVLDKASRDQQWAAAVAGYGMLLEGTLDTEVMSPDRLTHLMQATMASKPDAYQSEFYSMVKKSEPLLKR